MQVEEEDIKQSKGIRKRWHDHCLERHFITLRFGKNQLAMELFSRRRLTTGLAQQLNNYGIIPCMWCNFFRGVNINTTAFCLGQYSLHLLLLNSSTDRQKGAVVVAQLDKRSLLIPEIRRSNPVIGKFLYWIYSLLTVEKTKIKKKEGGISPFLDRQKGCQK